METHSFALPKLCFVNKRGRESQSDRSRLPPLQDSEIAAAALWRKTFERGRFNEIVIFVAGLSSHRRVSLDNYHFLFPCWNIPTIPLYGKGGRVRFVTSLEIEVMDAVDTAICATFSLSLFLLARTF